MLHVFFQLWLIVALIVIYLFRLEIPVLVIILKVLLSTFLLSLVPFILPICSLSFFDYAFLSLHVKRLMIRQLDLRLLLLDQVVLLIRWAEPGWRRLRSLYLFFDFIVTVLVNNGRPRFLDYFLLDYLFDNFPLFSY